MLDRTSSDKPFQNMILGVAYYFKGHISDPDLEDILVIAFSPYFANRENYMEKNLLFFKL